MEILGKLKNFFDHPTKTKMHVICIVGIVCVAVCMIDWLISFGAYAVFYLEHSSWKYFFLELLKNILPNFLLLLALLLTFIHWLQGKRFRFQLAIPILLLYTFLTSIYHFISAWISPASSLEGNPILIGFSFLVTLMGTGCLVFLIRAMLRSESEELALITMIPILLNLPLVIISWILYTSIPTPVFALATVFSLFPLIFMRLSWLLFLAGWYMKQKELAE